MNSEDIKMKILRLKKEQEELYKELMGERKPIFKGRVNLERNNYDEPSTDNLVIERTNKGFGIFAENYNNSKYKRLRR